MADDAAAPDGELTDKDAAKEPEVTADTGDEGDEVTAGTAGTAETDDDAGDERPAKPRMSHVRLAMIAGLLLVVVLAGLSGWLGFRTYQSYKADEQRKLFLSVGRQGALNLTTIDWQHADADVQRILDSATGTFYDDFQKRSAPFIEVVKQAQSKSEGTVAEAGLETDSGNEAQVLVAVTVKTSNAGAPDQGPRAWRMRLTVQNVGSEAKVSNVEFVP